MKFESVALGHDVDESLRWFSLPAERWEPGFGGGCGGGGDELDALAKDGREEGEEGWGGTGRGEGGGEAGEEGGEEVVGGRGLGGGMHCCR